MGHDEIERRKLQTLYVGEEDDEATGADVAEDDEDGKKARPAALA